MISLLTRSIDQLSPDHNWLLINQETGRSGEYYNISETFYLTDENIYREGQTKLITQHNPAFKRFHAIHRTFWLPGLDQSINALDGVSSTGKSKYSRMLSIMCGVMEWWRMVAVMVYLLKPCCLSTWKIPVT